MNTPLYRIGTGLYHTALRLGSLLGVDRARRWVDGRKQAPPLPTSITEREDVPLLWMHCASLGEWEQGRPVLEAFRSRHPGYRALLTFYSPSGYDRCRNDSAADHVAYLPADTPDAARQWVETLRPDLVLFVKYEFWFYHLRALHRAGVPVYLVAASFRPDQPFFKASGSWWRQLLKFFRGVVVQQPPSADLLTGPGRYPNARVAVGGDPRMDRMLSVAAEPFTDPLLTAFTSPARLTIVAGSVWSPDLEVLRAAWPTLPGDVRIVIAPHQLVPDELNRITREWSAKRYTAAQPEDLANARVLLLDVIGILKYAYRYGDLAYVGGGFRTGLHNTLEPLAYGRPTVFGSRHQKFPEAGAAIAAGGAFSVSSGEELRNVLAQLLHSSERDAAARAQRQLAANWAGGAERTVHFIEQSLALSSAS